MNAMTNDLTARLRARSESIPDRATMFVRNGDLRDLLDLIDRQDSLFDAIQHGDEDHRAWLKEAINAHFAGQPVPPPRGGGRKEALIDRQDRVIEGLREALEPFAKMGQLLEGPFAPALFRDDDAIGMGGAWSENGEARTITFGDLRKALAALSSSEDDNGRG